MLGRIVTENEIVDAIFEMMPDGTVYTIESSGGGGFFVRINNSPENVLLRSADTYYQKLNDYCVMVEQEKTWESDDETLQERYPLSSGD